MHFTPEQIAKIHEKEATLPSAYKRDSLADYREGYFFVTLNTRDDVPILSSVIGDINAHNYTVETPQCVYTTLGKKIKECWQNISHFYHSASPLDCEAMPDHFHGLIHLKAGGKAHLGQIIRGFMVGCTHAYWDTLGIDWHPKEGVITPDYRDSDHTRSLRGPALFVRGYNDVEVLTHEQVDIKRQYIREQALRALIKGTFRDRFRIRRNCIAHGWSIDSMRHALLADHFLALDVPRIEAAMQAVLARIPRHSVTNAPTLDYIGATALLSAPRKLPLICHRYDANLFSQQRATVLRAAQEGAVIVSAFISPKEREIMKLLLTERLPVINIMDNGFAERYKPIGQAFYACGENRLMQISPWTYKYQRHTQITREMCLIMNELTRVITKMPDDWWKNN